MKKIFASRYWWLLWLLLLVGLNFLASMVHWRIDLTSEKRFTLSPATENLLQRLPDKVTVTVFLAGDMPAGFKQLSNSTRELLEEFRERSGPNLQVKFQRPGAGLNDTAKANFLSYVQDSLGIHPTNVKVTAGAGESQEERLVYAGALVTYGKRELPVNLLEGQSLEGGYQSLNNAEALLEYKFAHAIQKITADTVPIIGYLIGNGEPLTYNVYDLIERTLKPNYGFSFLPIDSVPIIPGDFDAVIIEKPAKPFSEEQKLKLDQFVMRGGKLIWLIDNLYAEMDSLMRTQSDFVAFDRGLGLEDILFRYGVRINQDLVQDLQCDKFPLVVGSYGNQPQMQLVPWYYFPVLSSYSDHPISKNLDNILSVFPNSIDTIATAGIKKTILLASSAHSRTLSTPAIVSLNSVKTEEELKTFNKSHIPIAVLLEGRFSSLFKNRISSGMTDTLSRLYQQPFMSASVPNKMIVISDADIVTNVVTQNNGPLAMGYNQFTNYQYANKDFFLNCIEYLVNTSGILDTRAKNITLRLLDPGKVESERSMWQIINIGLPILLILIFGVIYQAVRKRKYRRPVDS